MVLLDPPVVIAGYACRLAEVVATRTENEVSKTYVALLDAPVAGTREVASSNLKVMPKDSLDIIRTVIVNGFRSAATPADFWATLDSVTQLMSEYWC